MVEKTAYYARSIEDHIDDMNNSFKEVKRGIDEIASLINSSEPINTKAVNDNQCKYRDLMDKGFEAAYRASDKIQRNREIE